MPTYKVSKVSSTCRRKGLALRVASLGGVAVMPCSACAAAGSLCVFSPQYPKCSECIRRGIPCDRNFSEADFDRLESEKRKLEAALWASLARQRKEAVEAESLGQRIESLKKAQGAMIAREAQSLEQAEQEERQAQQANAALEVGFDEQQLAAFFGAPEGSCSGGNNL